jgi:hypothetical protein
MQSLLRWRTLAPIESEVWKRNFTTYTTEYITTTPGGQEILAVSHGVGPLTNPDYLKPAHSEGRSLRAYKVAQEDINKMISKTPSLSYEEFIKKKGPKPQIIIMSLDKVRQTVSGIQPIDDLRTNPLLIARAGGESEANNYLDSLVRKGLTKYIHHRTYTNHKAAHLGYFLNLGYQELYGIEDNHLRNSPYGNFVTVKQESELGKSLLS